MNNNIDSTNLVDCHNMIECTLSESSADCEYSSHLNTCFEMRNSHYCVDSTDLSDSSHCVDCHSSMNLKHCHGMHGMNDGYYYYKNKEVGLEVWEKV